MEKQRKDMNAVMENFTRMREQCNKRTINKECENKCKRYECPTFSRCIDKVFHNSSVNLHQLSWITINRRYTSTCLKIGRLEVKSTTILLAWFYKRTCRFNKTNLVFLLPARLELHVSSRGTAALIGIGEQQLHNNDHIQGFKSFRHEKQILTTRP